MWAKMEAKRPDQIKCSKSRPDTNERASLAARSRHPSSLISHPEPLPQNFFNYLAMDIGQPAITAVVAEGKPLVVDA